MPPNLAYHRRVDRDMPTNADGHVVHPQYFPRLPAHAFDAYVERWRSWSANWTKADWLPGLEEFLAANPRRSDGRRDAA